MASSKIEIRDKGADLKVRKRIKYKKLICWLLVDLAIALVILALLLYKPGRYDPPEYTDDKLVSPYLTNILTPAVHNGAQRGEPFDLVVTQSGINEVVAWYYKHKWPRQAEGTTFSAPEVLFVPDNIVLMGTAITRGVEFVVTIVLAPNLDEEGLLNLRVATIKIGAMNITPLARMIAKRMYAQRLAAAPIDTEDVRSKIVASLLNAEPFEPIFKIKGILDNKDKKVRVKKITIEEEKLILRLVPAS